MNVVGGVHEKGSKSTGEDVVVRSMLGRASRAWVGGQCVVLDRG